jgi:hypothetical protein
MAAWTCSSRTASSAAMMAAKFGTANLPGIMAGRLDKSARASAQQLGAVLWETKKAA